jgi:hypothetical protein
MPLPGAPSDDAAGVLATGGGDISTLFVSMSTRHPAGADVDYLRWHTLDHRPEQHRLSAVRASLRLVSTPECRAARATTEGPFGAVDHVMTYFFSDVGGLPGFLELAAALRGAGRMMPLLPHVERGVYEVQAKRAAPRVKVGADVLPWWPVLGGYLLVERGEASGAASNDLLAVDGVVGAWSASAVAAPKVSTAELGQVITYCFLDDDPVAAALRLRPILEKRWSVSGIEPLFAAPFHSVVPHEWGRHVP